MTCSLTQNGVTCFYRNAADVLANRPIQSEGDPMPIVKHVSREDKMNKTEAAALQILKAKYPDATIWFHSIKLQVGDSRCDYTPDFAVSHGPEQSIIIVEVKAPHRFRDKGRAKYQSAKLRYRCFRFLWMEKSKDGWRYEE